MHIYTHTYAYTYTYIGNLYDGEFSDGKRSGKGRMQAMREGHMHVYDGMWEDDRQHGNGMYVRVYGCVCVCLFVCLCIYVCVCVCVRGICMCMMACGRMIDSMGMVCMCV
jgi:hypothetical protein